ncbi:alpha/beta hydrolase [Gilvimarinus agarilyticus]|uniref:alpha/beta hydrolase n=1 Tax=Gilvimarinus sp. 2_MG-2023 TaxID=3062666 RepID=UPI001C082380|nr:alpha/beta hydrolase [Gilvimarinus sp. 2_MG-2023]MBU2886784.1 alpha/beta hydrolase [Gilvimarinus agarilyticus]MDO6571451.1 alpha/beta hydrolase [Gilvimarinus sp. 2_MG-2023]
MLFVTNRTPEQSARSRTNRNISFDYQNTAVSQYLYFCERTGQDQYTEIKSKAFFGRLKQLPEKVQLLLYVHGFNNNMEPDVFTNAERLQRLMDAHSPELVLVVPLIWPCDDDSVAAFADDYWDDQDAADASGLAFSRMLGKFDDWRRDPAQQQEPCLRRMNILAHSMGSRVLNNALREWAEKHSAGNMPQLFRNVFLVAADLENEILEQGKSGRYIVDSARNTVVYFASDDYAMPASKIANVRHKVLSRRLGMTGPEDLTKLPTRVYEVDCDDFNNRFDRKGHAYFLDDAHGVASPVIEHIAAAIDGGRVSPANRSVVLVAPPAG